MIEGSQYIETVKSCFAFLITEFTFKVSEEIINGSYFYRVRYLNPNKAVTISYDNAQDYLSVFISLLQNGELPNYDDQTKTLHLRQIVAKILPTLNKDDIASNNEYFSKFQVNNEFERRLVKTAKELRLCLKHLDRL